MTTISGETVIPNIVVEGKQGLPGKDGIGLKSTTIQYAASTSGVNPPSTGWQAQVPVVPQGQYLWTRTIWLYTDNTSESGYSVARIGANGNNGSDGIPGKDGVGIKSTLVEYAVNTSGTVKPASGWSTTIPAVSEGNFLWTRTTWLYTDNTSEMGYSVAKQGEKGDSGKDGIAGKDGVGVKTTTITYAQNTSGTTAPTSGWSTNVPTLIKGQYLWTRTIWTYTDNTSETGYTVSYNAKDGNNGSDGIAGKDGVGIKSTLIEYAVNTSGIVKPTSGWSTSIPSVPQGQYLWTRTTWSYTDNTTEQGFTVAKQGEKGDQGPQGPKGEDGDKGNDVFWQATEPVGAIDGDTWFKLVDGKATNAYNRVNGAWVEAEFSSQIITEELIGKTITGAQINGGVINGGEFINDYTNHIVEVNLVSDGKLEIENGILQAGSSYYLTDSSGSRLYKFANSEAYLQNASFELIRKLYDDRGLETSRSSSSLDGGILRMSLSEGGQNWKGLLDAKALTNTPWNTLVLGSAFEVKENNPPQYKIQYNLDGTRTVKFRGQFGLKSGNMVAGGEYYPFQSGSGTGYPSETTIPSEIVPTVTEFGYGATKVVSGGNPGGRLAMSTKPNLVFTPGAASIYVGLSGLSYTIA